jgi:hypothetical protein
MSNKGMGYRKDGKERKKLTIRVTPESIQESIDRHGSPSTAFEKVFTPKSK